ncbi:MAG: amidohydrolase family protein, partial [Candidatus Adiutricales bacterium]
KNAVDLLEKCVTEWGAKGIKLYPTTGFLPADRECYPFYERASAWKIPVYFHMGPENPPYYNQGNAHVALLLRVLVDFPDLTVVVAHLGFEFWRDLVALGKVRENVMCDFCAWQTIARQRYDQFCYILRKFLDEFGRDRVMFGTDAPILESEVSSKEWIEIIRGLPDHAPASQRFSEEDVSALLDGNARRLLDSIPDSI